MSPPGASRDAVTWLGWSTVLLEIGGARILTDPLLRRRVAHLRRAPGPVPEPPGDLDAVLVSHVHPDHLDVPSLRRLATGAPVVVPRGAGCYLRSRGIAGAVEVEAGGAIEVAGVTVRATRAEHGRRRRLSLLAAPALGFVVSGGRSAYFAGDTDLFPGMSDLAPDLDLALLPVAGWGRRLGPGHLNASRAALALRLLRPHVAVPIHWGTYAPVWTRPGAAAPWRIRPPWDFAREAARAAPEVVVAVLAPGERFELAAAGERGRTRAAEVRE